MKLSPNTIKILDNFSSIAPSMSIEKGKIVSVMAATKNIIGYAEIEEEFPQQVNIPKVSLLMHTLKVLKEPELVFYPGKNFFKVKGKNGDVDLAVCEDRIVKELKGKKLEFDGKVEPDIDILFSEEILDTCRKIASSIKLDSIVITNVDGEVCILIKNSDLGDSSDKYVFETGVTTDKDFKFVVDAQNIKNIPGNYTLKVFNGKVAQFKHTEAELYYWVSLSADSYCND